MNTSEGADALARGEVLRARGDPSSAERAFMQALSAASRMGVQDDRARAELVAGATIGLGRVELAAGSPERALAWFQRARATDPQDWRPLYWQGCAQGWLRDYRGAEASFTASLLRRPGHPPIHIQRAYARLCTGMLDGSFEDFGAAGGAQRLPDSALPAFATLLYRRREWSECERLLIRLVTNDPTNVVAGFLLGSVLEAQGRVDEAIEQYEQVVASERPPPEAVARLGLLDLRGGRLERAVELLGRARQLGASAADVLFHLGLGLHRLGRFEESVKAWSGLRGRPGSRNLAAHVAALEHERARQLLGEGSDDAALPFLLRAAEGGAGGASSRAALSELLLRLAARDVTERGPAGYETACHRLGLGASLSSADDRFPYYEGLLEWAGGAPAVAIPLLARAAELSSDPGVWLAAVRCRIAAGDVDGVNEALGPVARGSPVSALSTALVNQAWSDAADLVEAELVSDDRVSVLLEWCLARAGRPAPATVEKDSRWELLRALAQATEGHLVEAWTRLDALSTDLAPAEVALGDLARLMAVEHALVGSWEAAGQALARRGARVGSLGFGTFVDCLMFLMAGERESAVACLQAAVLRDPTNLTALHALTVCWFHVDAVPADWAIAALGCVLNDEEFWQRIRAEAQERYQRAVPQTAVSECRERTETLARAHLIRTSGEAQEWPYLRELAAARTLRQSGGYPSRDNDGASLACGPLLIGLLAAEDDFGRFVAETAAASDEDANVRLRQLFSVLGAARALLDGDRPEEALAAIESAPCAQCVSLDLVSSDDGAAPPRICRSESPLFDQCNPGYCGFGDRQRRLDRDAVALGTDIRLALACRLLSDGGDPGGCERLWREAMASSGKIDRKDRTSDSIANVVAGRARVLQRTRRLSEAVDLVRLAERVLEATSAGEELTGLLARLLTERGVAAGNDGRLEDAVADLRQANECNPVATRPLLNLVRAMSAQARRKWDKGDRLGFLDTLCDAMRRIRDGALRESGGPELQKELASMSEELSLRVNGWATSLAANFRYERALEILRHGLAELPSDKGLITTHKGVYLGYARWLRGRGDRAGARNVLERGLAAFPADPEMTAALRAVETEGR